MKKITGLFVAFSIGILSCNQSANKELKEAKEDLKEAKSELGDAKDVENEAAKAKEIAEWNSFKAYSDSSFIEMNKDLRQMELNVAKANKKDKMKLTADYEKTKSDLDALNAKMKARNTEFDNDLNAFDTKVSLKNQSFKREFKHDMDEMGKSFKDLFKNNVK